VFMSMKRSTFERPAHSERVTAFIKRRRERTVQRASNPSPSSTVAIPSAKRNSPPLHDICAGDSLSASTTQHCVCPFSFFASSDIPWYSSTRVS
jgi:hypothetical protein